MAHLTAELRNTALDLAFKPPSGKWWTPEMLTPGFRPPVSSLEEYDWRTEKTKMGLIGKRPDPVKLKAQAVARADTHDRFRQAAEAVKRGATREEIRLLMEA